MAFWARKTRWCDTTNFLFSVMNEYDSLKKMYGAFLKIGNLTQTICNFMEFSGQKFNLNKIFKLSVDSAQIKMV